MREINKYLLEKLHLGKNVIRWVNVEIPSTAQDDPYTIYMNHSWKKLNIPKCKYVVFKDKYRQDRWHFADTGDMFLQIMISADDFEDFDPDKDILCATNDLKYALECLFEELNITDLPSDYESAEDFAYKWDSHFRNKAIDTLEVLAEFYLGEDRWYDDMTIIDWENKNKIKSLLEDNGFDIN